VKLKSGNLFNASTRVRHRGVAILCRASKQNSRSYRFLDGILANANSPELFKHVESIALYMGIIFEELFAHILVT
jgi:hypothetical protein